MNSARNCFTNLLRVLEDFLQKMCSEALWFVLTKKKNSIIVLWFSFQKFYQSFLLTDNLQGITKKKNQTKIFNCYSEMLLFSKGVFARNIFLVSDNRSDYCRSLNRKVQLLPKFLYVFYFLSNISLLNYLTFFLCDIF